MPSPSSPASPPSPAQRIQALDALRGLALGGFLLWLRTRAGAAAGRLLAPLGRMALTNYVLATPVVLLVMGPLGLVESESYGTVFALTAAIVVVQAAFSAWWLGRFRYGPLEWVWRCGTWWQAVPNRQAVPDGRADAPDERRPAADGGARTGGEGDGHPRTGHERSARSNCSFGPWWGMS
ncbi:DUF418 domain-containing protein [Streptosporangium sp. CA-135522]|uniref:DUF418 domain-containing protein n=1 Tax=Streptosporangium sp. CA-135522 TaxID=3240072 RepID=UPI003D8EF265